MAGRPALRSPEREQAILNALRVGNTRRASAAAAEISEDTFARWMQDAVFSGAVTKAEADAELRYVGQLAKHAAQSPQSAQWWLSKRRRDEWGEKTAIELTGKDGGPLEYQDIDALPDHEKVIFGEVVRTELARRAELARLADADAAVAALVDSGET